MRFGPKKKTAEHAVEKPAGKKSLSARWRAAVLGGAAVLAIGPAVAPTPSVAPPAPSDARATLALPNHLGAISSTTCIPASEVITSKAYPQIRPVFERMAQQPISGAPVLGRITAPNEDVDACTSRSLPDGTLVAAYESPTRRLIVARRNVAPTTVAHEAFHAHQHITGGFTGVGSNRLLSAGDRATGLLLIEATAAAYGMVVIKEASLSDPGYARNIRTHDYGMSRTFNTAFDASYNANANAPETERRRQALQAGGQAVVRGLMNGQSSEWKFLYRPEASRYLGLASFTGARTPEYTAQRDTQYAKIGQVAPNLQLIPSEFFGSRGNDSIAANQHAFNMRVPATTAPANQPFASSPRRPAA